MSYILLGHEYGIDKAGQIVAGEIQLYEFEKLISGRFLGIGTFCYILVFGFLCGFYRLVVLAAQIARKRSSALSRGIR